MVLLGGRSGDVVLWSWLVSGVEGSLDLNGLTRLLVYGAFGLWCFRVSGAFFFGCGVFM